MEPLQTKALYKNDTMDATKLSMAAIALRDELRAVAHNEPTAKKCLEILKPLLEEALGGQLTKPLDRVPCSYEFHEGDLRRYPELESAYSQFAFIARGGDEDAANQFRDEILEGLEL